MKVIIEVRDGCVVAAYSDDEELKAKYPDQPIQLTVVDWDREAGDRAFRMLVEPMDALSKETGMSTVKYKGWTIEARRRGAKGEWEARAWFGHGPFPDLSEHFVTERVSGSGAKAVAVGKAMAKIDHLCDPNKEDCENCGGSGYADTQDNDGAETTDICLVCGGTGKVQE